MKGKASHLHLKHSNLSVTVSDATQSATTAVRFSDLKGMVFQHILVHTEMSTHELLLSSPNSDDVDAKCKCLLCFPELLQLRHALCIQHVVWQIRMVMHSGEPGGVVACDIW